MKILVIGSTGMIGSAFKRNPAEDAGYSFFSHATLEIKDPAQLAGRLEQERPDYVINTAAYVGVEPCGNNPGEAFVVNTKAVKDLAEICKRLDICLVHFSSDGVFDGRKGDYYTEADTPNPVNMYGMTKYMGDLFVQNICPKYYILRVPILFGLRENRGKIFLEKMYELVRSGRKELRIADDIISCPSFTDDIARGALGIIKAKMPYGLYHLKNEGKASLFEFADRFFNKLGSTVKLERAKASDFAAKEKELKPLNTSIRSVKIKHLRFWEEALDDYILQFQDQKKKGEQR